MRTLQAGLANEYPLEDPDWLADYDDPVVRSSKHTSKRFHRPDRTATEPAPACDAPLHDPDAEWIVVERAAADWGRGRSACQLPACHGGDTDA